MSAPIGYYVHHHGAGHRRRFERLSAVSSVPLVAVSQLPLPHGVHIASDQLDDYGDADADDPTAHGRLHWAPRRPDVMGPFVRDIVDFALARRPIGMIVDVSVEVALTARLCGLPVIVVRQHGARTDPGHRLAYDMAEGFLAPFPAAAEDPTVPDWIAERTVYAGYLGPSATRDAGCVDPARTPGPDDLVVIVGRGGSPRLEAALRSLSMTFESTIHVVGESDAAVTGPVVRHGWVPEPVDLLRERPVVIATAGNNSIADAAAAGAPLVLVPEDRPFDEQRRHAELLDVAGAAVNVVDPSTADWRSVIANARSRATTLSSFATQDGARRAVEAVTAMLAGRDDG